MVRMALSFELKTAHSLQDLKIELLCKEFTLNDSDYKLDNSVLDFVILWNNCQNQ